MRVAVIGANGQLGTDLCTALAAHDIAPFTHADFDICDRAAMERHLGAVRPEFVINTAAYHRVDDCEIEVERAFAVNAIAVHALARWCAAEGAVLVHCSTDYVFAGDLGRPLTEADRPEPLSVYGASKLAGEHLARSACPRHFIIRSCGLYGHGGSHSKGGNFVERMLQLAAESKPIRVVCDQIASPTYTRDLAAAIAKLIRTERYGLYHITNSGQCSWYEFARKIFELAGVSADLSPVRTAEYGARARRPPFSALASDAMRAAGLEELPPWEDALRRYLRQREAGGA